MPAYAYLRRSSVSDDRPGEASREAQEDAVRTLAARHGDDPIILVDWGVSGRKGRDKRPGYDRLLDAIEAGSATAVYSYSLSRLGRSLPELSRLIEDCDRRAIPVRLVADSLDTSTASGRLLANVLGSVAQFESDVAAERVRAAQAARVARGERLGPAFYPHPERVLAAFDEAGSFAGAAKLLNQRAVPTQHGRPWWPSTVDAIVRRHRPYIPNPGRGRRTVGAFRFARLLVCGTCGTHLTGSTDRRSKMLVRYQCRKASVIPHAKASITENLIMPAIQEEVAKMRIPFDRAEAVAADEAQRASLEARRERIIEAFLDGVIDRGERERRLQAVTDEMQALDARAVIVDIPTIDWSWGPRTINDVMQAMFTRIELDPATFMPRPGGFGRRVEEWWSE